VLQGNGCSGVLCEGDLVYSVGGKALQLVTTRKWFLLVWKLSTGTSKEAVARWGLACSPTCLVTGPGGMG